MRIENHKRHKKNILTNSNNLKHLNKILQLGEDLKRIHKFTLKFINLLILKAYVSVA